VCSQMCTLMSKKHLCNIHTCPSTSTQNTCSKVHATLIAKKCTYIHTHTHMHPHTYAHEYTRASWHHPTRRDTDTETHNLYTSMHTHTYTHVYTCIQIHLHMHMKIHTYMHVCTHTYIHTYIHTHTTCTYARTQARLEWRRHSDCERSWYRRRKLCSSPPSTQSTTFGTSNARTSLYSLPETLIPLNPPFPLPNIPQNSSWTAASVVLLLHTHQHNTVHNSEEAPCSFIMAPCIAVKCFEAKQWCSRAPVGKHAGARARDWTMWLFTRNERSGKNNQTPQQPISPSRQRASLSPPSHLLWCWANPPGLWSTPAALRGGHPTEQRLHFCHFCTFFPDSAVFDDESSGPWRSHSYE